MLVGVPHSARADLVTPAVVVDPTDVEPWLQTMRTQRWTFAYHPDTRRVDALAAYRQVGPGITDVVILSNAGYAYGYRAVLTSSVDPFAPDFVQWTYSAEPVWVLRAALAMPAPGGTGAPGGYRPIPEHLTVAARRFVERRVIRRPS